MEMCQRHIRVLRKGANMYYITNGKVLWRIDSLIGEWYKQGVFAFALDGWKLLEAGNISLWLGWLPGTCGELIPKTKAAKIEFKKLLKETKTCGDV